MTKEELLQIISKNITDNNNGLITAQVLRDVLGNIVNESYNQGYTYIGIATPSTTPMKITAEDKVFYIAIEVGDYTGFGQSGIIELTIFKSDGGSWIKESTGMPLSLSYMNIQGYIHAITDKEGKLLFGIKTDGSIEWFKGVPTAVREWVENYVEEHGVSEEFKEVLQSFSYDNNGDYVHVITDKEDKVLFGIKTDGSVEWFKGVPTAVREWVENYIAEYGVGDVSEIQNLVGQIKKANYKPNLFFNDSNYGFSPMIKANDNKPLVYKINGFYNLAAAYPDGTIIYADVAGNRISRKNLDGSTDRLLTIEGSGGAFQLLWMDSNLNVYVSPNITDSSYQTGGLWKLPYGSDTFTHVLKLYNPDSEIASEQTENTFTIWTMTEDAKGHLYAGVYGNPFCPYIYKSTDGGDTWFFLKDMSQYAQGGIHIHFIIYNRYDNCLYCTVGEVNKLLKSTDGGENWVDMNVTLDPQKSCSALCVEDGIILGSDDAYWARMYKVYADGSHRITAQSIANAIFDIRESDVTGWLYARGVIDAATGNRLWYPPSTDDAEVQAWIDSNPSYLDRWREYRDSMLELYPEDAIIPQHSILLVSKDRGESWEVLLYIDKESPEKKLYGMGQFRNGECVVSLSSFTSSLVISEGRHKYTDQGIDCEGSIFIKLNDSNIVQSF